MTSKVTDTDSGQKMPDFFREAFRFLAHLSSDPQVLRKQMKQLEEKDPNTHLKVEFIVEALNGKRLADKIGEAIFGDKS